MARMIRPRRKAPRRPRRPHRRVAKRRGGKKSGLGQSNQRATIVETAEVIDIFSDKPYQFNFVLANFFRATSLAPNFKFYRPKKVKWEYMPLYNTFQENQLSTPAVGKPQMYVQMNREQDIKYSTLTAGNALFALQSAGVDPFAFVKNKEIIYKPNWCSPGLSAVTTVNVAPATPGEPSPAVINTLSSLGMKAQYGWIPTPDTDAYANPQTPTIVDNPLQGVLSTSAMALQCNAAVVFNGHNLYIQQDNENSDLPIGKCICTVEWEFKGGKQLYNSSSVSTGPKDPSIEVK